MNVSAWKESLRPTSLGFGLGFRPCHYEEILANPPKGLDWLEVISENFIGVGGRPRSILEQARDRYPVALHGVGLSIGSPDPIRNTYLAGLKNLVTWLRPPLISDHLCFTSVGRHNSHDLLPVVYTNGMLERIADRLNMLQDFLGQQFLLENPSAYVAYKDNDYTEIEFFLRLIEKTGCGVLLDVNNLFVNQMNLNLDPLVYLNALPAASVHQIHLAGHTIESNELGTVRIDTHDHPICDEVWMLYQKAIHKFAKAAVMIEWDAEIPPLETLLQGLGKARELKSLIASSSDVTPVTSLPQQINRVSCTDQTIQTLFSVTTDFEGVAPADKRLEILSSKLPVPRDLGARVYNGAYFARLRDVLKDDFPTLAGVTTGEAFDAIVLSYLQKLPPAAESVSELGNHLSSYLRDHPIPQFDFGVPQIVLSELAALDRARSEAFTAVDEARPLPLGVISEIKPDLWESVRFGLSKSIRRLTLTHDGLTVWQAVHDGDPVEPPAVKVCEVLVWRHNFNSRHIELSHMEVALIDGCLAGKSFSSIGQLLFSSTLGTEEDATADLVKALVRCFELGLVTDIQMS